MINEDQDTKMCLRAKEGGASAFNIVRRKYFNFVDAEIHKRCQRLPNEDCEDIAQLTWLAVWRSLPNFRGNSSCKTWIAGILKKIIADWFRRCTKRPQQVSLEETFEMPQHKPVEAMHDKIYLHSLMGELSNLERHVVYLRYFASLTDSEISEHLHLPLGTVKTRIRTALTKLRRKFKLVNN